VPARRLRARALNGAPVMPEAARIEPGKDAGRPHTQAVCGRPRTPAGDDSQPRQALRVFPLRALSVGALACAILVLLACAGQALAAGRPLQTSFQDPGMFGSEDDVGLTFERARAAGMRVVKVDVDWSSVAPGGNVKPEDFDPADPADARYRWGGVDTAVKVAHAFGIEPFITISAAPLWAERSTGGPSGTNQPDPVELARFAAAAAQRYSGGFAGLPPVRIWEVWNEANASFFLNPQWDGERLLSPTHYRRMVNEVAAAVRSVHPGNLVIAGALFPFTINRSNGHSIGPLRFMRELLCLTGDLKPVPGCGEPVRFDIWSHHPYTSGGPAHRAGHPDSISLGDLPKMRGVLRAAVRAGRVESAGQVRFWVTEFSWDSSPPDPKGVPVNLHARWVAEALYRMWRSGVSLVSWFRLRDGPDGRESGLYFRCATISCARPKPALAAFRFPFVALRSRGRVRVWGRTPGGERRTVVVERKRGRGWARVATLRADSHGIFRRLLRTRRRGRYRARIRGSQDATLSFSLKRTPDLPVNPFGS
jgi:hypothetical protein